MHVGAFVFVRGGLENYSAFLSWVAVKVPGTGDLGQSHWNGDKQRSLRLSMYRLVLHSRNCEMMIRSGWLSQKSHTANQ